MTKIRSIGVFSVAKVCGVLCGVFGLLVAPLILLGPGLAMVGGERRGFGASVLVVAILPFVYGFMGFIVGGLMAFLYNAISMALGGIEVELDIPPRPPIEVPQAAPPLLVSTPVIEIPPPTNPEAG